MIAVQGGAYNVAASNVEVTLHRKQKVNGLQHHTGQGLDKLRNKTPFSIREHSKHCTPTLRTTLLKPSLPLPCAVISERQRSCLCAPETGIQAAQHPCTTHLVAIASVEAAAAACAIIDAGIAAGQSAGV